MDNYNAFEKFIALTGYYSILELNEEEIYNNFKKTIGTFDTLVTCRDYANKIYQLTYSDINTNALVSNVQVSDIKDDINFANKIVSFDQFGIFYSDVSERSKIWLPKESLAIGIIIG